MSVDWLESNFWIESQDFTPEHCTSWRCCAVCLRPHQKQRPTCPLYHQGPSRPIPLRLRENLKMENNEGRMYWNLVVLINQWLECDSFVFAVYYFPWIHVRIFAVYGILVFCIWFFATRFSSCYEIWLSHRQNNIFLINDWSSIPCIIFHKYADFSSLQNFGVLLWDINSSDQEEQ